MSPRKDLTQSPDPDSQKGEAVKESTVSEVLDDEKSDAPKEGGLGGYVVGR